MKEKYNHFILWPDRGEMIVFIWILLMRGRDRFYNLSYSQSQFWQQETNMKKKKKIQGCLQMLGFWHLQLAFPTESSD